MPSKRPLQVADRIKEIIANALESRVKDPRLGFVMEWKILHLR